MVHSLPFLGATLALRVGFEPWELLWNLQVTDSTNARNAQNSRKRSSHYDPITIGCRLSPGVISIDGPTITKVDCSVPIGTERMR